MQVKNKKHTMVNQSFISIFALLLNNTHEKKLKIGIVK
jgi:hypothetical protein